MIQQKHWRIAGVVFLALAGLMTWAGGRWEGLRGSSWLFLAYWGLVVVFVIAALYMALLDFRYIRMEYALHKRALYHKTFNDEELRRALKEGAEEEKGKEE